MSRAGALRRLGRVWATGIGVLTLAACGPPGPSDPGVVQLHTDDVQRFWHGVDAALTPHGYALDPGSGAPAADAWRDGLEAALADALQRHYLDSASGPVERFLRERGITASELAGAVRRDWDRYARARELAAQLAAPAVRERMRDVQERLHRWYPRAAFPAVHLAAGTGGSGGTAHRGRIVLALEATADADALLQVWAHELAHAQQRRPDANRVLNRALLEGGADLAAEWLTGIPVRSRSYAWGAVHEAAVREAFAADARTDAVDRWFGNPGRPDWPPDLGYFAGYRIFRTGLDRAGRAPAPAGSGTDVGGSFTLPSATPGAGSPLPLDTAAALSAVLRWRSGDAVLEENGWAVGSVARVMQASHRRMGIPGAADAPASPATAPGATLVAEGMVTGPDGRSFLSRVESERGGGVRVAQAPDLDPEERRAVRPAGPADTATLNWLRGHELHALLLFPETRLFDPAPVPAGPDTLALRWMLNARDSLVVHYAAADTLPLGVVMTWTDPVVTVSLEEWAGAGPSPTVAPTPPAVPGFRRAVFRQGEDVFTWDYTRVAWALPEQDPPR